MRRKILMLVMTILLCGQADLSQSRAYAKFGSDGETIGLFNLIKNATRCGSWQVFTGTITSVRSEKRNEEFDYRFTLKTAGKLRLFTFSLGADEIPRADIASLVAKKRGIKVRACERKNRWFVDEIVRTETARSDQDTVRLVSTTNTNRSQ